MMTVILAVAIIVLLGVIVTAYRLNRAIADTGGRFRVLLGGYSDADVLTGARRRLRQRQQRFEAAVDSGAAGLGSLHHGVSRLVTGRHAPRPAFYEQVRVFNRGLGRTISTWFAPQSRRRGDHPAQRHERGPSERDDGPDRDSPAG